MKVLMLHSGGMSGRQWRRLSEVLGLEALAPDFLGCGNEPPWTDPDHFHFHQDLDRIENLLLEQDQPVHLIGHSYGGLIALQLSLRQPQRIASLAVYDPVAFGVLYSEGDEEGLRDLQEVAKNPVFLDDARGGGAEWMATFVNYWNGPGYWEFLPESTHHSFLRVGRKLYLEVRSLSRDRTPATAYQNLPMPTLLLYGGQSPRAAQRVVSILSRHIPAARLECLPQAGHMGPLTHAFQFEAAIQKHLSQAGL